MTEAPDVSRRSLAVRYAVAVAAMAVAVAARLALTPWLGADRVPYITLFAALLFVGWYCALVPALVALAIGAVAIDYFILPPLHSIGVDDPNLTAGLVLFLIMGSVCAAMGSAFARAQHRAEANERLALARQEQLQGAALETGRLATIVESSDDAIVAKSLEGVITSWNAGAERLFGYTSDEAIGKPVTMLIPPDRFDEEPEILAKIRRGSRIDHYETVRRRKDGSLFHISLSVSPIHDAQGRIVGASKIGRDITQRREQEEALVQYRQHLEELVERRTAQVLEAQTRLQHAERMASIGTLSAGLGHDIGNVLMPLDVHVRSVLGEIESGAATTETTQESFAAIGRAIEYLRNLSNGLRMLARDPTQISDPDAVTDFADWWRETSPLLEAMAQRQIAIRHEFPEVLPRVRLAKHLLTQVIFNLVQNAVHALAGRSDGQITIWAGPSENTDEVELGVSDNGPGMSDDVKSRCIEPFFTTKTRGISSGLGLAIVNGIVRTAHGSMQVDSTVGQGTTFTLRLPATASPPAQNLSAAVTIADVRLKALVTRMLGSQRFAARQLGASESPDKDARLWIMDTETVPEAQAKALQFLNGQSGPKRRVVMIQSDTQPHASPSDRIVEMEREFRPGAFRDTLEHLARELQA